MPRDDRRNRYQRAPSAVPTAIPDDESLTPPPINVEDLKRNLVDTVPPPLREQIAAMAAYVASLAPGPAIPDAEYLRTTGDDIDLTHGSELFRINCAMCHNAVGAGGALTEGKFAPALGGVTEKHIYEAMVTGPQNMPVFNDANLTPEDKRDIIAYLKYVEENDSVGGYELASIGPVAEGLFVWIFGLGFIIAITVWLGAKAN